MVVATCIPCKGRNISVTIDHHTEPNHIHAWKRVWKFNNDINCCCYCATPRGHSEYSTRCTPSVKLKDACHTHSSSSNTIFNVIIMSSSTSYAIWRIECTDDVGMNHWVRWEDRLGIHNYAKMLRLRYLDLTCIPAYRAYSNVIGPLSLPPYTRLEDELWDILSLNTLNTKKR